jgi:hypothetical protein
MMLGARRHRKWKGSRRLNPYRRLFGQVTARILRHRA